MNAIQMAQCAEAALGIIEKLAKLGGNQAEAALAAIRGVLSTLREGFDGKLAPQAVLMQIENMQTSLAENDEAAIAELKARFER